MKLSELTLLQWLVIGVDLAAWAGCVYFGWHYFNCVS